MFLVVVEYLNAWFVVRDLIKLKLWMELDICLIFGLFGVCIEEEVAKGSYKFGFIR